MKEKLKAIFSKKWVKQLIRLVLGIGAVYIIINKVDLNKAWEYIISARPLYLVLALLSFFISRWFAAFRVNRLYQTQGLILERIMNVKLYFLGMFYNLFIPLIGGEGYKAIWLKNRFETKYKSLVSAAFLDRLSGVALLAVLSLIFAVLSSLNFEFEAKLILLLIPLIFLGHYLFMKWFFKSFLNSWIPISIHSFVIQALQVVTTYFILLALGQSEALMDYLFIFLLSSFAFVLPMIGAREMAFVFGAESMGLDMELSLAVSLLFYLCTAINSLMGSYFLLFPKKLDIKEIESSDNLAVASDPSN